jgi:hypothetical protein
MMRFTVTLSVGLVAAATAPAFAQRPHPQTPDSAKAIPAEARPPKGMCRIWIEGVPASQQPAPSDCQTAVKNRPTNSRVIFGDDYAKPTKGDPKKVLPVKGFTDVKSPVMVRKKP